MKCFFTIKMRASIIYLALTAVVTSILTVSTMCGGGTSSFGQCPAVKFNFIEGITIAPNGVIYAVSLSDHQIFQISTSGVASLLAGSSIGAAEGTGGTAQFNYPYCVTVDSLGTVYVADYVYLFI